MPQDLKIESIQKLDMLPVPHSVYAQALAAAKVAKLHEESIQTIRALQSAQEMQIVQVTKNPSIKQIMLAAKAAESIKGTGPLPDVTEINIVISKLMTLEKSKDLSYGPVSQCDIENARLLVKTRYEINNLIEVTKNENEILRTYLHFHELTRPRVSFLKTIFKWFLSTKDDVDFYHKTLNEALASSMEKVNVALQKNGVVK